MKWIEKIKSSESTYFAYRVWKGPFILGTLVVLYYGLSSLSSLVVGEGIIPGVLKAVIFTLGLLLAWVLVSSLIFGLAYLAKKLSRKAPFLVFLLLPLPITILTFFIFYKILLMDREEMMILVFIVAFFVATVILLPTNIIVWRAALKEYRKRST